MELDCKLVVCSILGNKNQSQPVWPNSSKVFQRTANIVSHTLLLGRQNFILVTMYL